MRPFVVKDHTRRVVYRFEPVTGRGREPFDWSELLLLAPLAGVIGYAVASVF